MKTTHPEAFDIEFDRDELRSVFARSYRYWARGVLGFFAFFAFIPLFAWLLDFAKYERPEVMPAWFAAGLVLVGTLALLWGCIWLGGELFLRLVGTRLGEKRAQNYSARVEGAFLRIINGKSDRKTHFRQIGDYEAVLGNKRKPEVGNINMMLASAGGGQVYLALFAVANVLATRDLLAEVDAARE